jgi:hypothetical protein
VTSRRNRPKARLLLLGLLVVGLATLFLLGLPAIQPLSAQGRGVSGPLVDKPVKSVSLNQDLRTLPPAKSAPPHVMFEPREHKGVSTVGNTGLLPHPELVRGQMPAPAENFAGLSFSGSCTGGQCGAGWPPDTNGDVGPNNYIETINTSIGIFSKTGTQQVAITFDSFWSSAHTGTPCDSNNYGDPVALYDPLADRWLVTDFAFTTDFFGNPQPPFYQCLAVSKTSDPVSGGWWLYAFLTDNSLFPDYPKLSVWPDAYYMTANMFNLSSGAQTSTRVWALNRSAMLNGQTLTAVHFDATPGSSCCDTLLPANLRGASPPSGEPAFIAGVDQPSSFRLYKFHVDWNNLNNSTLTGPTTLTVNSFAMPCNAGATRACVPESGGEALDSVGDRLMMQLQYRNIGGTESLWANHTVANNGNVGSVTGIRWYEIRNPNGTPTVYQQGTYMPDSTYRWMGSLAVDQQGNMALGFSASSSSIHPAIRYVGRLVTDPLGTLPQAETTLIAGGGSQSGGGNRWGDYSAMSVDPSDDCTFWYTQEYYATTGQNWQTRIGAFKYSGCSSGGPTPTPTNTSVPPTNTPTRTNTPTNTPTRTNTPTSTSVPPTNTPTRTNTPIGPSPTPTNTSIAPSPTPTRTNTPPPTATRTNTPAPTATPTVSGGNVVVNPGFESGPGVGWAEHSSGGYELIDTSNPHTGSYSADLCGYNYCTEWVQQQITIPSGATLKYWWYMISREGTSTAYDHLYVRLYTTGGSLITTLRNWSNRNTRNTWSQDSISLSSYAGQTVILRFMSKTDSSLPTTFWVDDVSVQ